MGILSGMVSGFGQGLAKAGEQLQTGIQQYMLQDADRAFQTEKLAEQNRFTHQENVDTRAQAAALAKEGYAHTEKMADKNIAAQAANTQTQAGVNLTLGGIHEAGEKERAEKKLANEIKLAEIADKTHRYVADQNYKGNLAETTRKSKEYESSSKELKAAHMLTLVKEFGNEEIKFSAQLAAGGDPVAINARLARLESDKFTAFEILKELEGIKPINEPPFPAKPPSAGGPGAPDKLGPPSSTSLLQSNTPLTVEEPQRAVMPRGVVSPEQIAKITKQNLQADIHQLEKKSRDPHISEKQRVSLIEELTQKTSDLNALK